MTDEKTTFITIKLTELRDTVLSLKAEGARFMNLHATTVENGFELTYSFTRHEADTLNYRVNIEPGTHIPAISDTYLASFVFENEIHDLFGIDFDDMALDFHGEFYQVAVTTPMAIPTQESDMHSVENTNETLPPASYERFDEQQGFTSPYAAGATQDDIEAPEDTTDTKGGE